MLDQALITTVERHLLEHKGQNPHATEEFSWLMSGITLATKTIAAQIQRVIDDILTQVIEYFRSQ